MLSQHLETDCENVFTVLRHCRKGCNLQKFPKIRHSGKEALLECATRPLQTQMMVLERELQHAESTLFLVQIQIPEFMQQFQDELKVDQFFKVISYNIFASMELKSDPSTTTQNRTSWVVICRGMNRYVDELHLKDPGHNPTSSEFPLERSDAKESEPCSSEINNLASWKLMRRSSTFRRIQCTIQKKLFSLEIASGMIFLPVSFSEETPLQAEISNMVVRLVHHIAEDERETDGAVHWISMSPKLRKACQKAGGQKFSDTDWLQHIHEASNKMRFQYCMNSKKSLVVHSFHSRTHWWNL